MSILDQIQDEEQKHCGWCGKLPESYGMIGDQRFCHEGDTPTCFMRASQSQTAGEQYLAGEENIETGLVTIDITDLAAEETARKYARTVELRKQIDELTFELSNLETDLGGSQKGKWAEIDGVGKFERYRTSAKTTWDHERLCSQVIQVAREQRIADENGEVIEDPIERTVHVMAKAASFSWRVGDAKDRSKSGLSTFGIPANEYREKEQGILKVRLVPSDIKVAK